MENSTTGTVTIPRCEHKNLKYHACCDKVSCIDCKQSWGGYSITYPNYWQYPYGTPYYQYPIVYTTTQTGNIQ